MPELPSRGRGLQGQILGQATAGASSGAAWEEDLSDHGRTRLGMWRPVTGTHRPWAARGPCTHPSEARVSGVMGTGPSQPEPMRTGGWFRSRREATVAPEPRSCSWSSASKGRGLFGGADVSASPSGEQSRQWAREVGLGELCPGEPGLVGGPPLQPPRQLGAPSPVGGAPPPPRCCGPEKLEVWGLAWCPSFRSTAGFLGRLASSCTGLLSCSPGTGGSCG